RLTVAGGVVIGLVVFYLVAGGAIAAHVIAGRATEKLGRTVTVGGGHGGFGAIVLDDIVVAGAAGQAPLLTVKQARRPLGLALGMRGTVLIDGLRIAAVQGGAADNVSAIADKLRGRHGKAEAASEDGGAATAPASTSSRVPDVVITDGALDARDEH